MPICVVFSSGRSGTNMVLSILEASESFYPTEPPEDKEVFKRNAIYIDGYLTKSDTTYCRSYRYNFAPVMLRNPAMRIVWPIRDPRDWAMSKLRAGWKRGSDDATFEGCIADLYHMLDLFKRARKDFPERIYPIKMEDVILSTVDEIRRLCKWLNISYNDNMLEFYKRVRHSGKRARYNKIDKGQVALWKDWKNVYDGMLTTIDFDIEDLFKQLDHIIQFFGY